MTTCQWQLGLIMLAFLSILSLLSLSLPPRTHSLPTYTMQKNPVLTTFNMIRTLFMVSNSNQETLSCLNACLKSSQNWAPNITESLSSYWVLDFLVMGPILTMSLWLLQPPPPNAPCVSSPSNTFVLYFADFIYYRIWFCFAFWFASSHS